MTRRLALCLPPEQGESLASWLTRVAFDTGTPAGVLAVALGLPLRPQWTAGARVRWFGALIDHQVCSDAATASGVHPDRIRALHLQVFDGSALDLSALSMQDESGTAAAAQWQWMLLSASRACPLCLAERPGYWPLWWRLAYAASCPTHGCYLVDACPTCGIPLTRGYWHGARALSLVDVPDPTLCGNYLAGGRCPQRLSLIPTQPASPSLLNMQQLVNSLLALAAPSATPHVTGGEVATPRPSVLSIAGTPVTITRWFAVLRDVAALINAAPDSVHFNGGIGDNGRNCDNDGDGDRAALRDESSPQHVGAFRPGGSTTSRNGVERDPIADIAAGDHGHTPGGDGPQPLDRLSRPFRDPRDRLAYDALRNRWSRSTRQGSRQNNATYRWYRTPPESAALSGAYLLAALEPLRSRTPNELERSLDAVAERFIGERPAGGHNPLRHEALDPLLVAALNSLHPPRTGRVVSGSSSPRKGSIASDETCEPPVSNRSAEQVHTLPRPSATRPGLSTLPTLRAPRELTGLPELGAPLLADENRYQPPHTAGQPSATGHLPPTFRHGGTTAPARSAAPPCDITRFPSLLPTDMYDGLIRQHLPGTQSEYGRRFAMMAVARAAGAETWAQAAVNVQVDPGHGLLVAGHLTPRIDDPLHFWDDIHRCLDTLRAEDRNYRLIRERLQHLARIPDPAWTRLAHRHGVVATDAGARAVAAWVWAELVSGDWRESPAMSAAFTQEKVSYQAGSSRPRPRRSASTRSARHEHLRRFRHRAPAALDVEAARWVERRLLPRTAWRAPVRHVAVKQRSPARHSSWVGSDTTQPAAAPAAPRATGAAQGQADREADPQRHLHRAADQSADGPTTLAPSLAATPDDATSIGPIVGGPRRVLAREKSPET